MKMHSILAVCEAYAMLGTAVQQQVRAVLDGEPIEDQNPDALRLAQRKFIAVAARHGVDVSEWDGLVAALDEKP